MAMVGLEIVSRYRIRVGAAARAAATAPWSPASTKAVSTPSRASTRVNRERVVPYRFRVATMRSPAPSERADGEVDGRHPGRRREAGLRIVELRDGHAERIHGRVPETRVDVASGRARRDRAELLGILRRRTWRSGRSGRTSAAGRREASARRRGSPAS